MTLTLLFHIVCMLCGHREQGSQICFQVRVTKRSVRVGNAIMASPQLCQECGWPMPDSIASPRMRPDAESAEKVRAYRQRKGWAA